MPRPSLELDQFRDTVLARLQAGNPPNQVRVLLEQESGISISRKTFYRRLDQWGFQHQQVRTDTSPELEARLTSLFFEYGLTDKQLLERLRSEGFQVSITGIRKVRRATGLFRRGSADRIEQVQQRLREFFEDERISENLVRNMGRGALYIHLRQRQFVVSRNIAWAIYQEFHQSEVDRRRAKVHRRRGGWTCPGPNYTWSIDGYCKLEHWGFEIYSSIDAYSRFITWFYVGISANTARSVFAQYVRAVSQYRYIPRILHADCRGETTLIAGAHYWLSLSATDRPNQGISSPNEDDQGGSGTSQQDIRSPTPELGNAIPGRLEFRECFKYGKSTRNIKIERWWGELCQGRALFWIVSVNSLIFLGRFMS